MKKVGTRKYGIKKVLSRNGQIARHRNSDGTAVSFDSGVSGESDRAGVLGKIAYVSLDGGNATVFSGVRILL